MNFKLSQQHFCNALLLDLQNNNDTVSNIFLEK